MPNVSFVASYDTVSLELRSAVCEILHYLAVQWKHLFQVSIIPGNRYFRIGEERGIFHQLLPLRSLDKTCLCDSYTLDSY